MRCGKGSGAEDAGRERRRRPSLRPLLSESARLMAQIEVFINGKSYQVACDDGQEERVRGLAKYVDGKVAEFAQKLGQAGEARLMLLASLAVADELAEATESLRRIRRAAPVAAPRESPAEQVVASGIDQLAQRLEAIAERLEKSQV